MEQTELCVNTFTEIAEKIGATIVSFMLNSFGVISDQASTFTKPNDGILLNLFGFYKQFISFMCFDNFQIQLLKVFLLTLFTIVIMIYGAWYVYGPRISERFMYPGELLLVKYIF